LAAVCREVITWHASIYSKLLKLHHDAAYRLFDIGVYVVICRVADRCFLQQQRQTVLNPAVAGGKLGWVQAVNPLLKGARAKLLMRLGP
jgi:hypothetical protein